MEDIDEYNEYDYPDLGYQDSQKSSEEVSYGERANQNTDNFQEILYQKNSYFTMLDSFKMERHIFELMNELIDNWGVSQSFAIKLLKKSNFNKKKASRLMEEDVQFDMMDIPKNSNTEKFDCEICFSSERVKDAGCLECEHLFCKDCFLGFLENAINEGQVLRSCPHGGCKEIISPKIVEKYYKDHPLYEKYKRFFMNMVVTESDTLLWCPAPACGNTISFHKMTKNDNILSNIRCDCGYCFCLQCKDVAHRPLTCEKYQKWMNLIGGKDDTLNEGWIKKNTKQCPKCKVSIEKNEGCMHMTCRSCKHEFCWLCAGDWREHGQNSGGYYKCNRYTESNKSIGEVEREYEKFNFYRDRYELHASVNNFILSIYKALRKAVAKRAAVLNNFQMLNGMVIQMEDDAFLKESLDLLIEARRAITMTYPVGYYLKFGGTDQEMFETQQSILWAALDGLDKFTDDLQDPQNALRNLVNDIKGSLRFDKKFNDYRINLINRASGVTTACNKLLRYIEQDLQNKKFKTAEIFKVPSLSKKKSQIDKEYWYCGYCTYANTYAFKKCEMCQKPKNVK